MSGFCPRFFVSNAAAPDLRDTELTLDADDSYHASRVLRLQPGDRCEVVVGAAVYAATVSGVADRVRVRVTTRLEGSGAGASYDVRVGIVQALGRSAAMEHVLEKGTEVGASFFMFVKAAGSPKKVEPGRGDRLSRWGRIVREAAKQSKQVTIPEIRSTSSVDEALSRLQDEGACSVILDPEASERLERVVGPVASDSPRPSAGPRLSDSARPSSWALWIGPEGGWTSAELERFKVLSIPAARLGKSVLRTETAGPVAVAVARLALGDW